jgi:hypothetical protein
MKNPFAVSHRAGQKARFLLGLLFRIKPPRRAQLLAKEYYKG